MTIKTYLLSLPERLLRSGLGLGAGVAREVGEVALPDAREAHAGSIRTSSTRRCAF